jgi:hypothetical protein
MKTKHWSTSPVILAMLLALVSCGGDSASSSSNNNGSGDDVANGGIGGSGSGTASDYGSIIVNGSGTNGRELIVEAHTRLSLDGTSVPYVDGISELPLGATVEFLLAEDVSDGVRSGTAIEIRAYHRVIGPVTSLSPLAVLNQNITLEDGTVFGDNDACMLDPDNLAINDVVAVAGPVKADGSIVATRLVDANCDPSEGVAPAPVLDEWRLLGRAHNIAENSFAVGAQTITTLGTPFMECPATLNEQQKVYVRLSTGVAAAGLNALEVTCVPEGIAILSSLSEVPSDLPVSFSGVITDAPIGSLLDLLNLDGEVLFEIDGQTIRVDSLTAVLNGTLAGLQLGVHVDVDGTLGNDGIITAEHIYLLPSLLELIDDILGDILRGLLTDNGASSNLDERFIESPIVAAHTTQHPATLNDDINIGLVQLSINTDTHINIIHTSPQPTGKKFLAALQHGIDVALATAGDVVF